MHELHVRAVSARNLLDKQTFGKQDPFCKLSLGAQKFKTRVHDNGDRSPVWNEKFVFQVVDTQLDQLHLQVKDKGFASNVLIGECRLPVSMFQHGGVVDQWFPLNCRNQRAGEINLRVQLVGAPGQAQGYPAAVPYAQKQKGAVYGQPPQAQAYPTQAYPQATPYAQPQPQATPYAQPQPQPAPYSQAAPAQPQYPPPNYPVPPQPQAYPAPQPYPQPMAYPPPQPGMAYAQPYPPQQPMYVAQPPVVMGAPPVVVAQPHMHVMGHAHMGPPPMVFVKDKHHHHGHHGHHGHFGETAMGVGAGVLGGMLLGDALGSIFD